MKWLYNTSIVASLPPATYTGGGAIEIVYVPEHESGYIKLNKFDNIGLKPLE